MLQWMGGSRRKVTASRMSTQKRQKQYFEQRKRQEQNLHMMGSDNCSDRPDISGQNPKEHRSLDILNLLNLSTNAKKCNSSCLKGRDDGEIKVSAMPGGISSNQQTMFANMDTTVDSCRLEETRAPSCCKLEASPKKVFVSAPGNQNTAFSGPPSHGKKVTDQYLQLSVFDLLYDDEPNATVEKRPTCEDHVSFSLEGLGKVGTETPVHSPEQHARIPYSNSLLLKNGRKSKLKNLNHVLDDIELEMDSTMRDIKVSPISSSNLPFNKVNQSFTNAGDCKHYYDDADKNVSSINEEFFFENEYRNEDTWNASSCFLDEKFDNEDRYDTSWKKTFQLGSRSPEPLKGGTYKMDNYAFQDLPNKWSSATAMQEINMSEPRASFFEDQLENDFDFYAASRARCSRLDGNLNSQNLFPEYVRDNSSLPSEESSSSTAVRSEFNKYSSSRTGTGENRRKHRNAFESPGNMWNSTEEKCRGMSTPSKRKSSHHSNSILQEEFGAHNSWQFDERYASVDIRTVATSFCQDLEENFAVRSNNRPEDPFSTFTTPESHNKATPEFHNKATPEFHNKAPSFGGFRDIAPLADSPPYSFTAEKVPLASSTSFLNVGLWPTSPSLSTEFQFKGKPQDAAGFHRETSSTDISAQGSFSKGGQKLKMQKDRCKNLEEVEDIFMGDNEFSSEKQVAGDASTSYNQTLESEATEDTNPETTPCLVTADSPGHVEEMSLSPKKPRKHENQVDKRKSNCEAETPLKCKIRKEEMKKWQPEGRNTVSGKHNNKHGSLSGQVMFASCVFQLLCVQKVFRT
ncbi:PREDICTED: uncharacterized protein LOC109329909 isoform X2 [Lupinus angustifolius]|uniref:uncharacterized protein LOC109329909 isoform X2 n=1 Tax=Lupinus angustifolius TaxID=3871 RepID=UPI00092F99AD|nr:PREDICTED: uncharacterized protein LOC109329909 isoform X2 [Lupinus angustifolius]